MMNLFRCLHGKWWWWPNTSFPLEGGDKKRVEESETGSWDCRSLSACKQQELCNPDGKQNVRLGADVGGGHVQDLDWMDILKSTIAL